MTKKFIGLIGFAVVAGSLLAGCGTTDQGSSSEPKKEQSEKVTVNTMDLKFREFKDTWNDKLTEASKDGAEPSMKDIVEAMSLEDVNLKDNKFSKKISETTSVQGTAADNEKLIEVEIVSVDTENITFENMETELMSGFMAYAMLFNSLSPDIMEKGEKDPFVDLGITDENGNFVEEKEGEEAPKSVVYGDVKYSLTGDGIKAEVASR